MQNNDTGDFEFHQDGFTVNLDGGKRKVIWAEIEEINAYKLDLFTTDEICIDFVLLNSVITVAESKKGWNYLIEIINKQFSSIKTGWDCEIVKPAFATNFTTLYQRAKLV